MYLLSLAYTGTMWNGTGNKSKLHSKKSMKIQTSKLEKINKVRTLNTNPFMFIIREVNSDMPIYILNRTNAGKKSDAPSGILFPL